MYVTLYLAVPRLQVYQPHVGITSKVVASFFLFPQHNFPNGPRRGDNDHSVKFQSLN